MNWRYLSLKYVLSGLLLLISFSVAAQKKERAQIDSLLRQLPAAKSDSNKVNLLLKLGRDHIPLKKTDSATFYLQSSLQLAAKIKWDKGVARANYWIGDYYYNKKDYVKAQNYLEKAAEMNFKMGDYESAFEAYKYVSAAVYELKKMPGAVSYLLTVANRFEKCGHTKQLTETYMLIAAYNYEHFNFSGAMDYFDKALQLEETSHHTYLKGYQLNQIGYLFKDLHQNKKAKALFLKALKLDNQAHDLAGITADYVGLSQCTQAEHDNAGTAMYFSKALQTAQQTNDDELLCNTENEVSWDNYLTKNYDEAYVHAKKALSYTKASPRTMMYALSTLGSIYRDAPETVIKKAGIKPGQQYQKALDIILKGLDYGKIHGDQNMLFYGWQEASLTYEKMHRYEDAFKAYKNYIAQRDSTDSLKNEKAVLLRQAQLGYSHKEDSLRYNQNITNAQLKQKKQQSYFFIGGIAALVLLSVFIGLNFNNQRKSNQLLSATLADLKAAQQQLVQSEKMASLGELTAGIAHEIQNPLNFVNNFSEVSRELLIEMKEELAAGNVDDVNAIAADLDQNLAKISHHGKRADFIVKGMLQHSRTSTGEKQPTNINILADEFLKLSFHGLRSKDKSFNAAMVTHFDDKLPKITVVQQDMGRVLLNLFNNAFYAVSEKAKTAGADYQPEVTVTTAAENNMVVITVKDNGTGIPDAIKGKIMQPFFTTKPTGQGTGLGLSLSYDIVVKGHNGTIDIESAEGEGTEFWIKLPAT